MNAEAVAAKVKEIIADVADLDAEGIGDDSSFIEDLGLDSLTLLEIGVDVDYHFKLGVSDEELKALGSVRQTVELVQRTLAARATRSEVA